MACSMNGCLCNRLVISEDITYADNTLTINIPTGGYNNNQRYCLLLAQTIPAETTIVSNAVITIGEDTTEYPLINADGTNVAATQLRTRTLYPTVVKTNVQSGVFKLLNNLNSCSRCTGSAPSLPIPTTTTTTTNQKEATD